MSAATCSRRAGSRAPRRRARRAHEVALPQRVARDRSGSAGCSTRFTAGCVFSHWATASALCSWRFEPHLERAHAAQREEEVVGARGLPEVARGVAQPRPPRLVRHHRADQHVGVPRRDTWSPPARRGRRRGRTSGSRGPWPRCCRGSPPRRARAPPWRSPGSPAPRRCASRGSRGTPARVLGRISSAMPAPIERVVERGLDAEALERALAEARAWDRSTQSIIEHVVARLHARHDRHRHGGEPRGQRHRAVAALELAPSAPRTRRAAACSRCRRWAPPRRPRSASASPPSRRAMRRCTVEARVTGRLTVPGREPRACGRAARAAWRASFGVPSGRRGLRPAPRACVRLPSLPSMVKVIGTISPGLRAACTRSISITW